MVGELSITPTGLRYTDQMATSSLMIGSGWNNQKWLALYLYNDGHSFVSGFGAYVPHFPGSALQE